MNTSSRSRKSATAETPKITAICSFGRGVELILNADSDLEIHILPVTPTFGVTDSYLRKIPGL